MARFSDIPKLMHGGNYTVDVQLNGLVAWIANQSEDYSVELNPDFQRGHVWTDEQRCFSALLADQGKVVLMSDSDKGNIGAILAGIGLALWLFYGSSAIFAVRGDESLNTATTWIGFAAALSCIGIGFPLVVRYGRSKPTKKT